jgi:transcriptional regulator with XRE-family HTH domain
MRPSDEMDDEFDRDEIRKNYASRDRRFGLKPRLAKKNKRDIFSSSELSTLSSAEMKDEKEMQAEDSSPVFTAASVSLEDELKKIYTDSFAKHLQQIINKKGLKNSEVYATANINKQYFSKLLKGQVNPSKEKVLALAVGLRLNLDETVDFLKLAGYALSPISQTDTIVAHFIRNKKYNVIEINLFLFDMGLDGLTKEVD